MDARGAEDRETDWEGWEQAGGKILAFGLSPSPSPSPSPFSCWDRISLCHPGWSAAAQSQLAVTSISWIQPILVHQPLELLRLQAPATTHAKFFVFLLQMGFFHVGQTVSLCCPGSSPVAQSQLTATSASWVQEILILQPPQVAGTTGMDHHA
ncbi:hypothetical protein AAY473_011390 [Plecturocebus cupreus]